MSTAPSLRRLYRAAVTIAAAGAVIAGLVPAAAAAPAPAATNSFDLAGISTDGNSLTLGRGTWSLQEDSLAIVAENGETVAAGSLDGLDGTTGFDVTAVVSPDGKTATFAKVAGTDRVEQQQKLNVNLAVDRAQGTFKAYTDFVTTALNRDPLFVAAGAVAGGLLGVGAAWLFNFFVTSWLVLIPVAGYIAYFVVLWSAYGIGATVGAVLGSLLAGQNSQDGIVRDRANNVINQARGVVDAIIN